MKRTIIIFLILSLAGIAVIAELRRPVWWNAPRPPGALRWPQTLPPSVQSSADAGFAGAATQKVTDANPNVKPYYEAAFVVPEGTFAMNHGSSLVELDNGDVFLTWFAGSEELANDVQIYSSRYRSKTRGYSPPRAVVHSGERARGAFWADKSIGNTVLFYDDAMILWLFYNAIPLPFGGWSTAVVNYKQSRDRGQTWSAAKRFVNVIGNLTRNAPVRVGSNTFLVPLYTELLTHKGYVCRVEHVRGDIAAQNCNSAIDAQGAIQPALATTQEGSILMLLRDQERNSVRRSWSYDHGQTWSPVEDLGMPNPDAAVALTSLDDGRILLVYNDSADERTPLSVAVSTDGGRTFRKIRDLETSRGKFSYPAVIQTKDSLIHVTYTYNHKTIKHVRFNKQWLFTG